MNEPWEDFNLELIETERIKVSWRTSPNQKTHCMSVLLPYNKENRDLYRQIIANLKWLRTVFKNPNCNDKGFIIKRNRANANALDAWSDNKGELEGLLDILRQVVAFKQYAPLNASVIATPYCRHSSAPYNGANFIAKDDDNQSFLIKLNTILDVKTFVYPNRMEETVTFVSCGDPEHTEVAITCLLNANQKVTAGVPEHEAFSSSVADAMEWKTKQIENQTGMYPMTYEAVEVPKSGGTFADAVRSSQNQSPVSPASPPPAVGDSVGEAPTQTRAEVAEPDAACKPKTPEVAFTALAGSNASYVLPPPPNPRDNFPNYVTWDVFMHAMAEQKLHFDVRIARMENAFNMYTTRNLPPYAAAPAYAAAPVMHSPYVNAPPGFTTARAPAQSHADAAAAHFTGLSVSQPHQNASHSNMF